MLRENGFRVKRYRKISPRLNRYNTIVWFPNDQDCPSSEATDALENWLTEGYLRTLIYVGRDYDAEVDLYQHLLEDGGQDSEGIYRLLAEARLKQDQRRRRRLDGDEDRQKCDWFELSPLLRRKAIKMSGPWAENVNGQSANIELSTWLRPSPQVLEDPERVVSTLLAADEQDFAYSIENRDDTGKIIVISNGSFLLNFGLVNHANRRIANELIEQCRDYPTVVFLESGPNGITVSDKDSLNHNSWAWIAQPPLRYIVPISCCAEYCSVLCSFRFLVDRERLGMVPMPLFGATLPRWENCCNGPSNPNKPWITSNTINRTYRGIRINQSRPECPQSWRETVPSS